MVQNRAAVEVLANAHRHVLVKGDAELAGKPLQLKILHAIVADSALRSTDWIRTRVDNGADLVVPLEGLAGVLAGRNPVGTSLASAQSLLVKQAKSAAATAVATHAWPLWLASVVAFFAGVFTHAQTAGEATAQALVALVAAGGGFTLVVVRGLQNSGKAIDGVTNAANVAWSAAANIGQDAQRVFATEVPDALKSFGVPAPVVSPVLAKIRGAAQLILGAAYVLTALCGLFFLSGFAQAFN